MKTPTLAAPPGSPGVLKIPHLIPLVKLNQRQNQPSNCKISYQKQGEVCDQQERVSICAPTLNLYRLILDVVIYSPKIPSHCIDLQRVGHLPCKFSGKDGPVKILDFILIFFPYRSLQKSWIDTRSGVGICERENRICGPELGLEDPKPEKRGKTIPTKLLGVIHDHFGDFIHPGKAVLCRQLYIGFFIRIRYQIFSAWKS